MVFCISVAILTTSSCFVSSLVNSFIVFSMPPPRIPSITGTIVTVYPGLLSFILKASYRYRVSLSFRFGSRFCCMGHAMSQVQICFLHFVSSIKSEILVISDFRRLNWKSKTSFTLSFSKTVLCSHCFLYHTVSAPTNLHSFSQVTASVINALLCLAKYLLLNKAVHPVTRCSTVSYYPWHARHLSSSISLWASFQDLVSTICSRIDMIDDALQKWRFWVSQRWHSSSCSLKNLLC